MSELPNANRTIVTNATGKQPKLEKRSANLAIGDSRFSVPTAELLQATAFESGR
jgi:hypothetical protein